MLKQRIAALMNQEGDENWADIRTEMGHTMEAGCGIYRQEDLMQATIDKITELESSATSASASKTKAKYSTLTFFTLSKSVTA